MGNVHTAEKNIEFNFDDKKGIIRISENVANELRGKGIDINKNIIYTSAGDNKNEDLEKTYLDKLKNKDEHIDFLQKRIKEIGWHKQKAKSKSSPSKPFFTRESFEKVLNEFHSRYKQPDIPQTCHNHQVKVLNCYKENEHYVLNCSAEAKKFVSCVSEMQKEYVEDLFAK